MRSRVGPKHHSYASKPRTFIAVSSVTFAVPAPSKGANSVTPTSQSSSSSTKRAVARATVGIGAFHLLRLLIGFATQPLIANNLGLLKQADIYAVATDIVSSLWLFFEKTINGAVLPIFQRSLKEDGEDRAWRFAATILFLTIVATLIVAPLAYLAMPRIVDLYSQKASLQQRDLTTQLARLGLAALGFLTISSLTYVFLNGYKRFAAAAMGDTLWKLGIFISAVWALVSHAPLNEVLPILTYGFVLGSVLKLVPHLWALRKLLRKLDFCLDWSNPRLRQAALLAIPLLLGVITSEGRDVFRNWIADSPLITNVEGSRAALKFSRTITSALIQVFPYALSIGIFPYLADLAINKDREGFTNTIVGALRACIFVFAPITTILIAMQLPILRAVWEGGRFTPRDTLVLAAPFTAYCLGLIGLACENVLNQSFYAQTRAWMPTVIGLGTTALFIIAATCGVSWGWGLAAIAGAESLSKTVKCLAMWKMLQPNLAAVKSRDLLVFLGKVLLASLIAAALSRFLVGVLMPVDGASKFKLKMLMSVGIAGIIGMGTFGALAVALKIEEMNFLKRRRRRA